jgi:hypothetical protein
MKIINDGTSIKISFTYNEAKLKKELMLLKHRQNLTVKSLLKEDKCKK